MNLETKLHPRVLDRYNALSDEMQQAVRRAYDRHLRACERSGVQPDPMFTEIAISEAEAGRK